MDRIGKFECRITDYHGDDDWAVLDANSCADAAILFAQSMDRIDGEAFPHEEAIQTVLVKHLGDRAEEAEIFLVGFNLSKSFYATRQTQ